MDSKLFFLLAFDSHHLWRSGLDPLKHEDIAEIIRYVLAAPPHVVLADITVFPTAQVSATVLKRETN
jgi:NADP-dependent 3-hydroxy acid dehydrogenase YdfG